MKECWWWICLVLIAAYILLTCRVVYCVYVVCKAERDSALCLIGQLLLALVWPGTLVYWMLESIWYEVKELFHD